jgi:polyhydroxyalkanoate synthesis regulator protein
LGQAWIRPQKQGVAHDLVRPHHLSHHPQRIRLVFSQLHKSRLSQQVATKKHSIADQVAVQFLRQLIRFYGDSMQAILPGYLNLSMDSFSKNHERMREQLTSTFGGKTMLKDFEGLARQNMAMFERTLRMFTPFGALIPNRAQERDDASPGEAAPEYAPAPTADQEIAELKAQIDAMRRQLDDLANRK